MAPSSTIVVVAVGICALLGAAVKGVQVDAGRRAEAAAVNPISSVGTLAEDRVLAPSSWPPSSIGFSDASVYGFAPRAYFYAACSPQWCDAFGGIGPSRQVTSDMYEVMPQAYPFPPNAFKQSIYYLKITPPGSPSARSGGKMVMLYSAAINEWVGFTFGGSNGDGVPLRDMYIYRYMSEIWVQIMGPDNVNQLPLPLTMFSMVTTGGANFTIFFGASSRNGLSSSVFEGVLDASTMQVTQFVRTSPTIASNSVSRRLPIGRLGACCVASTAQRLTVCFGGVDGISFLNDTWIYDHSAVTWASIQTPWVSNGPPYPTARFEAMCAYYAPDDTAILYGGFADGSRTPVADTNVYTFAFATRTWSVRLSIPDVPVRGAGALFVTNSGANIEILGGQGAAGILGDRWILNGSAPTTTTTTSSDAALIESDSLVPEAREFHSSVLLGNGFIVAFGRGTVLYNSVYYCANFTESGALRECLWIQVLTTSANVPAPRFGASACAKGNVVYFFGGFTSSDYSQMSNELWSLTVDFETITNESISAAWTPIISTGASPGGSSRIVPSRAWHSCVLKDSQLIVVAGVVGAYNALSGSVEAFDLQKQTWNALPVNPPLYPRAGFAMHWNGSHAFIIGGVAQTVAGREVLADVVALYQDPNMGPGFLKSAPITTNVPILRAFAASAGSGNTVVLCGGALYVSAQLSLGAPVIIQCAMVSIGIDDTAEVAFYQMFRLNSNYDMVEAAGIGGGAVMLGKDFIVFGGSITERQVARDNTYYDSTDTFDLGAILCTQEELEEATNSASQPACLLCGPGSRNPTAAEMALNATCTFAPPGTYIDIANATTIEPCPAGRSSNVYGASSADACELCAEGSYADTPGMTHCLPCPTGFRCPLGAVTPQSTAALNATASQHQPSAMDEGETPVSIFLVAGALVLLLLIVLGIVSHMARRARADRRAYFFNQPALDRIREVYVAHKRAHFGLDAEKLQAVLLELGATCLPPMFVQRVLAENDEDGSSHITYSYLLEVLVAFIDKGLLKPFPGTGQALNPGKALSTMRQSLARFTFKDLDAYDTEHALGVEGEAIRIHSTWSGGVTRLTFNILAVGVVLALVGQFVYTNVSESRATTPSVNFDSALTAASIVSSVTAVGGVQSWQECSSVPVGRGACVNGNGLVGETGLLAGGNFSQRCAFDAARASCTISLQCMGCALDFGQSVTLSLKFGLSVYAQALEVDIDMTTGIAGEHSLSSITIAPPDASLVLRGYPATAVTFPVLPTTFEAVDNIVLQNTVSDTGYHVLLGSAELGNTIDSSQATQYFGVPVSLSFAVDSNVLSVKRLPKATVLDFLSQLLGSITGMGGILVTLMQAYDAKFISRRHEKLRAELEDDALIGNNLQLYDTESDGGGNGTDAQAANGGRRRHLTTSAAGGPSDDVGLHEELISFNRQ